MGTASKERPVPEGFRPIGTVPESAASKDVPEGFRPIGQVPRSAPPLGFEGLDPLPPAVEVAPLPTPQPLQTDPAGPMVLTPSSTLNPRVERAARAGVVYDRPAPAGQALASFAFDRAERLNAYGLALERELGEKPAVRIGPDTDEIEYFDPDSRRWTLVNPPGFDPSSLAGPAVAMAPEMLAAVPTAILSKSPLLTETAAGAGAFVGELMRLEIGRQLGINKSMKAEDQIEEAAKAGGVAFVSGLGAEKLTQLGKFIIDISRGTAVGKVALRDVAEGLAIDPGDAQKVADYINDTIGAEKLRFNLAQATNDEDLLGMADYLRRSRQFAKEFRAFEEGQAQALEQFYDTINSGYTSTAGPEDVARAVRDSSEAALDRQRRRTDEFVKRREAELDNAIASLRTTPYEQTGRMVREVGDREQQAFRAWSQAAADQIDIITGDKEFVTNSNLVSAVNRLDQEVQEALFPSVQQPTRRLIGPRVTGTETTPEPVRVLRETITGQIQPEEQEILNRVFDPDARFTFGEAWRALSALKRVSRISGRGLSTDAPDVGAVKMLVSALERDIRTSAQGSPIREMYDEFVGKYRAQKRRLDEGTVGRIMTRDGGKNGRFRINNEDVFRQVFQPGGETEARELVELIGGDHQAMQGMRESITDFYKREVMEDGRINPRKHQQFMQRYDLPLRQFFNKEQMGILKLPGQMEAALRNAEDAHKNALDRLNKTFEAELADLNPRRLLRFVMDPDNTVNARQIVKFLEDEGATDALRGVRSEFRKEMGERVAGQVEGGTRRRFSPANLNRFLYGKSGEKGMMPMIRALFGEGYANDLAKLDKAFQITAREPRFPNRSNTAFWTDTVKNLARAYVGLFTRPGRFLTAAAAVRGRAANRVLANAILNPQNLEMLMATQGKDLRDRRVAAVIGALGGSALLQDAE